MPRSYELGGTARERWNTGVFGPGFPHDPDAPGTAAYRWGDTILFSTGMYGDQNADTQGGSFDTTGSTQLLREDEVIAESSEPGSVIAGAPPEEATYTARTTATRPGTLSTRIDAEWTFRSAGNGDLEPIPALALRFAPDLD